MHRPDRFYTITICALVRVGFAALVFSWAGSGLAAMLIQGIQNGTAPASNYDRFDNSSAWIGNPANWTAGAPPMFQSSNPWTGVGRDITAGRWATLISPSYIIGAAHDAPNNGDTVQFFYGNNANGPSQTRTVVASESLQYTIPGNNSDIWIGKLSSPITDMASYPILTLPSSGSTDPYGYLGISTFGLSDLTGSNAGTAVRLGRNTIWSGTATSYPGASGGTAYAYYFTYDNPGLGPDESQVISGDSGAPSFFNYSGGLPALVGLHWFNNAPINTVSADTWLSNYVSDIQTGMNQLGNPKGEKVKTISPLLGDFNLDGKQTSADVAAMAAALNNLSNFKSTHGMNNNYLKLLGDFNADGVVNSTDYNILSAIEGGGLLGDTNSDGTVDIQDLINVMKDFGNRGPQVIGDTNGDHIVDLTDYNNVENYFGLTISRFSSVPEPTGLVLTLIGGAVLLTRSKLGPRPRSDS